MARSFTKTLNFSHVGISHNDEMAKVELTTSNGTIMVDIRGLIGIAREIDADKIYVEVRNKTLDDYRIEKAENIGVTLGEFLGMVWIDKKHLIPQPFEETPSVKPEGTTAQIRPFRPPEDEEPPLEP